MKNFSATGTSFQEENWKRLFKDDVCINDCEIVLAPDNKNKFDQNAVKVIYEGLQLGFMNRSDALLYRTKFADNDTEVIGNIVVTGDQRKIDFTVDLGDGLNHYVYKITNLIDGHYYIGKRSCRSEVENDTRYMGSGKAILSAIYKHGKENFKKEILYRCGSASEAFKKEADLVTLNETNDPLCYNKAVGGADGYKRTPNPLGKLWDQIDILGYLEFYRDLKSMSQDEIEVLERSLRYENMGIRNSSAKAPDDEERMLIWDMRFKNELIRLVKGLSTKERIAKIFSTVDVIAFLDAIPD